MGRHGQEAGVVTHVNAGVKQAAGLNARDEGQVVVIARQVGAAVQVKCARALLGRVKIVDRDGLEAVDIARRVQREAAVLLERILVGQRLVVAARAFHHSVAGGGGVQCTGGGKADDGRCLAALGRFRVGRVGGVNQCAVQPGPAQIADDAGAALQRLAQVALGGRIVERRAVAFGRGACAQIAAQEQPQRPAAQHKHQRQHDKPQNNGASAAALALFNDLKAAVLDAGLHRPALGLFGLAAALFVGFPRGLFCGGLLNGAGVKQLGRSAGKVLNAGALARGLGGVIGSLRGGDGGGVKIRREVGDVIVQHRRCGGTALRGVGQRCFVRRGRRLHGPGTADAGVPRRFRSGRLGRLRGRRLRVRVRFKADNACRLGDLGRRRGGIAAVQRAVRGRGVGRGRLLRLREARRADRRGLVKIEHRLKIGGMVGVPRGRRAAAQREPHRVAAAPGGLRHNEQRPVMAGAERDAGICQLQAEQTSAQQVQDLVADEGIVHVGRQGAGHRAAAVTHQHKGALPDAGGHVGGSVIRARNLQRGQRTARCGLHNVAGEASEQLLRHGDAAGFLRVGVALGAKVKDGLAVGQRLQKAAQQAARRLVHGNQQLAFFQQSVQRGLGQAGLPLGKDIVAELGAQPRGPFIAVLLRHGAVGGADLHTDGKLAVPFQQTQAGAAIIPDAPQHGGYLRARGPENTQDFQLSVDHGGTFLCLEMLPSLSVGADSISARGSFLQPQTGRAHIECAPTVLRFKYLNLCPPSPA